MKIAIFGTGGVGGYFGGVLAKQGHEVTFIARGDHLRAIQENGLSVFSPHGDFSIIPARATNNPATVGSVDYVIVAVKHYHLEESTPLLKPLIGPDTTVVPLLNGVDAHEILGNTLGRSQIVGGLCSLVSMVEKPGVIRQLSQLHRIIIGELDRKKSPRVEKIVQAWVQCGVEAVHSEDIYVDIWTKFLFIASFGGVSSLTRTSIGEIRENIFTRELYIHAIKEVESLARALAINLDADVLQKTLALTDGFEATATSSMQRDVAAENVFELEAFSGKIVKLGAELNIPTPVHQAIYALLQPSLTRAMHKKKSQL